MSTAKVKLKLDCWEHYHPVVVLARCAVPARVQRAERKLKDDGEYSAGCAAERGEYGAARPALPSCYAGDAAAETEAEREACRSSFRCRKLLKNS